MNSRLLLCVFLCIISINTKAQVFFSEGFSDPSLWSVNVGATVTPAIGINSAQNNIWAINSLNFFDPSGPIVGNSLKVTIRPGTDFDGFGLAPGYAGYDPFNVGEPNISDVVALYNTNISTVGYTGIEMSFDYQSGGWLGLDYGTVLYSTNGGVSWQEFTGTVTYNYMNTSGVVLAMPSGSKPAVPASASEQNAFSNIDGFLGGFYWHRASFTLPASCEGIANLRIGFRWRNIDHTSISPDYVGLSFNIDNITLSVPGPVAAFSFDSPVCAGDSVIFNSASSTAGSGTISGYSWFFESGTPATSSAANPAVVFETAGSYEVKLVVTNSGGIHSDTTTHLVVVEDCAPNALFLPSATNICATNSITFTDASTDASTWEWTFPTGIPASALGAGPHTVAFPTAGTHAVSLTVSNDFGSDTYTQNITVVPAAAVHIGNDTTICQGSSLVLNATTPGALSYLWNTGSPTPTITVIVQGWYWVDVTIGSCVIRDSIYVSIAALPDLTLDKDTVICNGESFTIVPLSHSDDVVAFLWNTGATTETITVTTPGVYSLTVFNSLGCARTRSIQVYYQPSISGDLLPDELTICGESFALLNPNANGFTYLWSTGALTETILVNSSGTYWVEISGCFGTIRDSIEVRFADQAQVDAPNIFTPNGDGANDFFVINVSGLLTYKLSIYNRWGSLVYTSNDINQPWDGKNAPDGLYYWEINYTSSCQTEPNKMNGQILLTR